MKRLLPIPACLLGVCLALLLAGCASSRAARPAAARLVGTWRSQTAPYGIPVVTVITLRADGTYTATSRAGGGPAITDSGRWAYRNGIITFTSPLVALEKSAITWINENQVRMTCVAASGIPGVVRAEDVVGQVAIATRVR